MKQPIIPLLAVDGGGTKCLAILLDEKSLVLGTGKAGSCNYHGNGVAGATQELRQALEEALSDWKKTRSIEDTDQQSIQIECAVFGMAGLDTEYDRTIIMQFITDILKELSLQVKQLLVENDCVAALLGATEGKPGILAIAGTGSIVCGINQEGISLRAGGWGHRVGDEGSGYWIGKEAVIAVLKEADGRLEATCMTEKLLGYLDMNDVEELFHWVYSSNYSVEKMGELARLVSEASAAGDLVAQGILKKAGVELFAGIKAVMIRLNLTNQACPIILQGGVLQNEPVVRQVLMERLASFVPHAVVEKAKKEPIHGVIAMGIGQLNKK
ncbi:N-acetylglucosamine kinase [Brevibacillus daliensis]|uniref:N-acetylglucosamine kinase n=1 Tax=Brevibacillus daliensis TaxID=2892995 RepID=UPI001E2D835F|nr:BadF/BadG/BcrA/BcrD ATPase family protein [Brevibacillus daliensis]